MNAPITVRMKRMLTSDVGMKCINIIYGMRHAPSMNSMITDSDLSVHFKTCKLVNFQFQVSHWWPLELE